MNFHRLTVIEPVAGGLEIRCLICRGVVGRWWYSTEGTLYGESSSVECSGCRETAREHEERLIARDIPRTPPWDDAPANVDRASF